MIWSHTTSGTTVANSFFNVIAIFTICFLITDKTDILYSNYFKLLYSIQNFSGWKNLWCSEYHKVLYRIGLNVPNDNKLFYQDIRMWIKYFMLPQGKVTKRTWNSSQTTHVRFYGTHRSFCHYLHSFVEVFHLLSFSPIPSPSLSLSLRTYMSIYLSLSPTEIRTFTW